MSALRKQVEVVVVIVLIGELSDCGSGLDVGA